jgi:RND family efflux transporter MFP subunit
MVALGLGGCGARQERVVAAPKPSTYKVEDKRIKFTVEATGEVHSSAQTVIRTQVGGTIEKISVVEGNTIEAGSVICNIASRRKHSEYKKAEADLRLAKLELDKKEAEVQSATNREVALIDVQIAKAKIERTQIECDDLTFDLEQMAVKAPFRGKIVALEVQAGDLVSGSNAYTIGSAIGQIVPDAEFSINTTVGERELANITDGQAVRVTLSAFEGREFAGKITRVGQVAVDGASRARVFPITVTFNADSTPVRIGMTAKVSIPIDRVGRVMTVPLAAVQSDESGVYLLRKTESGTERRAVMVGLATTTDVEILSGVSSGDEVIVVQ